MEPVGVAASLVALIGVTAKTIQYLSSVKEASKERKSLLREASDLLQMLINLQSKIEDSKQSKVLFTSIETLNAENGPLDQLREALEQLSKKLKPQKGIKNVTHALTWALDKDGCSEVLGKIERVKSRISLALQGNILELAQAIKTDTAGINAIRAGIADLQVKEDAQERQRILNWFSPMNFYKTQQDIFSRRAEGTGEWLLNSPEFQNWFASSERTLCCVGMPGAGKSVLASIVVNFLRSPTNLTRGLRVGVVYCKYTDTEIQSPENLLASLCMQSLDEYVPMPETLVRVHGRHYHEGTRPTLSEIRDVFFEASKSVDDLYLVVDALDECLDQTRSIVIRELRHWLSDCKVLVTTRPIEDITREFATGSLVHIHAHDDDLKRYIQSRMTTSSRLSALLQGRPDLQQNILDGTIKRANRMFLAAKLHLDSLSSKTNVKALKKAIESLPNTLNQLYDAAFRRIDAQSEDDQAIANKALRWVAYAFEPLKIRMLCEILAIDSEANDLDSEASPPINLVLNACAGLLVVDGEIDIVRLVHYTAQDYFNTLSTTRLHNHHAAIAEDCITYLSYDSVQDPAQPTQSHSPYFNMGDYDLLSYASRYWASHVKAGPKNSLNILVDTYLARTPRVRLPGPRSKKLHWIFPESLIECSGCGIAACFGLHDALMRILENDTKQIDTLTYTGCSALHLAASHDQIMAMEILLEYGADIDCKDQREATPLLVAIQTDSRAAVQLLLDRGAQTSLEDCDDIAPFAAVRLDPLIPVLQTLLNAGADINTRIEREGDTYLMWRVRCKDVETVGWLLQNGASVNLQNREGATALHHASSRGSTDMVKLLLLNNANPGIVDERGRSPLHAGCKEGQSGVVSCLLDHGVDVNAVDSDCNTALHVVMKFKPSSKGSDAAQRNVVMNAKSEQNFPAVGTATYIKCLDLLLSHHVDIEKADRDGCTPLALAIKNGWAEAKDRLLKAGASIT